MKNPEESHHPFEPAQDELPPGSGHHFKLDRRKFLKVTGGGLVVAFVLQDVFSFAGETISDTSTATPANQVGAWIHIDEDGKATVYTGKVEVGQNIRTSLSQVVAEELMVPLSEITLIMGDTDLVPYDAGTFGSRSTPQMGTQLRKAAATARQALKEMAAKKWGTTAKELHTNNGMVVNAAANKKISYGELTKGEKLIMTVSDNAPVVAATNWKVTGTTVKKINGKSLISGRHEYVSDMKLPGMLYGKVLRAPSYKAELLEADITNAQTIPGVTVVKDGNFVGVAATDIQSAEKALHAIDAKWKETKDHPSNKNIFDYLVKNSSESGGRRNSNKSTGDPEGGLKKADYQHSNNYHIQYIAHVPLEPRAAVAQWEDGKLTVWTGTQRPFGVQDELAGIFRISKEKVRVLVPDTGSGYGGKHTGEAAIEAARLAKETKKPVKIVWSRHEEFTWAYFRPGGVITVNSGVNKDGTITAWKFKNYNSGGAGLGTQYKTGNQQIEHLSSASPLRQGSYRGLATVANVFARESHMTDMARLVNLDQLYFRLKNLEDERFIAVLKKAAASFGWDSTRSKGHGFGIAGGFEKGAYVATCAEVMVNDEKEVKVLRVTQAFDCGAIVNPHHLEQQVVGSIIQGLGGALFESVKFADGKILNSGLSAYRVPRFSDVPKVEILLVGDKDIPSAGAGEAAIIGIAPAIRNAILDASGIALNNLPLLPNWVLE